MSGAVWNVCVSHGPQNAGLFRGVNDFSRTLHAPILSFDCRASDRAPGMQAAGGVCRVSCGDSWPLNAGHMIGRPASEEADALLADSEGLLVHSLFRGHASWAMRWSKRHLRPYWAVPHGCLDPWGLSQRRIAKRLWMAAVGRPFLQGAARVLFATTRERDKAVVAFREMNPFVIPWPVKVPSLNSQEQDRQAVRRQMSIGADDRVLVAVSRLHSMKRPHALVRAFVDAAVERCHLVIVGGDEDVTREGLQRSVPAALHGRIHFTGLLESDRLSQVMNAADGFISLSHRENFCYSLADALAHGLPAILTPGHDLAFDFPRRPDDQLDFGWLLADLSDATGAVAIREFGTRAAGDLRAMGVRARAWVGEWLAPERFKASLERIL